MKDQELNFDGIERVPLSVFTEKAYLDYSMYVVLDRALPHLGDGLLKKIEHEGKSKAKPSVTRFKGLGEMNPSQLRETTMDPRTRRLVQLTIDAKDDSDQLMDMLLAKKRASDRREWLEEKGNLAEVIP